MKKINVTVVAWLLLGSLTMSSCIGSFTLFNKFAKWETQMTNNKYVNAIVGFIITPFVGSVCLLGDALLFKGSRGMRMERALALFMGEEVE